MHTPGQTKIELASWPRREHFEHYSRRSPCVWSTTVHIDVTALVGALRRSGRKSYLAHLWMLATVVNRHGEFRMVVDPHGGVAVWEITHPFFTVFNPSAETFSTVWAEYDTDFAVFHERALPLLTAYRDSTSYVPQDDVPENTFDVSSTPWTAFTSLDIQVKDAWTSLSPIFTIGGYTERDGTISMPLAVQANHATVDGFHVGRLVREVTELAADPHWLTP
ncbi:CatA-like O-acetyltransferase [Curtobacterium sp. ISL-83]|uniref:CatA-like O-acetyltransferase n=1 Tax=Curtobacterium sp. ISL-83 TaxID=2819145 RepID=UPI0027DF7D93|nr:CatA-like O-acetyltransferase [Curtobacterium sp. ISL-83]